MERIEAPGPCLLPIMPLGTYESSRAREELGPEYEGAPTMSDLVSIEELALPHGTQLLENRAEDHSPPFLKITSVGDYLGEGIPLWYSCLGNPMERGAWCAMVHGVPKN